MTARGGTEGDAQSIGVLRALSIGIGGIVGGGFFAAFGLTIAGRQRWHTDRLPDRGNDCVVDHLFLHSADAALSRTSGGIPECLKAIIVVPSQRGGFGVAHD
jgi:hypothetical protein